MKDRNYNLDFYRGFAILWILVIHSCFCSGYSYVPEYVRNLSLLIDVPLFIFLSGMTYHYSDNIEKNIKSIVKLYLYYVLFLLIYIIFGLLFYRSSFHFSNILPMFFFKFDSKLPFIVFGYSMWFMPMYMLVSLLGSFIIQNRSIDLKKLLFIFILYGLFLYYFSFKTLSMIFLYLLIYLFGYFAFDKKLSMKRFIIIICISLFINIIFEPHWIYGFHNMQQAKFNYDLAYLFYSLLSIFVVWLLYSKFDFHNRYISSIGKGSFIIYLLQGISSSIIYKILPFFHLWWPFKLLWMIIINISICLILFVIFQYIYRWYDKLINKCLLY